MVECRKITYVKHAEDLKRELLQDDIKLLKVYGDDGACVEYKRIKHGQMTNADHIRAMTDEELAEYILKREIGIVDRLSQLQVFIYNFDAEKGKRDLLKWLKREVSDD